MSSHNFLVIPATCVIDKAFLTTQLPQSSPLAPKTRPRVPGENIDSSNTRLRNIVGCFMTLTFLTLARDVWKIKGQIPSKTWKITKSNILFLRQHFLKILFKSIHNFWSTLLTKAGNHATLAKVTNVHVYILLVLCYSISVA